MQTAVEWLQSEFNKWAEGRVFIPQNILEEAKVMEKEQIINAHGLRYSDITEETVKGEQYYNQIYSQDRELGKEVTDLLENYKKDKTFKQKSKWTKL